MPKKAERFTLADADRLELERLFLSHGADTGLLLRAKILLLSHQGVSVKDIAFSFGVSVRTVYKWRYRYLIAGLAGIESHQGQPRKLSSEKAQEILRLSLEETPPTGDRWSVRLMARYAGVTNWQVQQLWKAASFKPHKA